MERYEGEPSSWSASELRSWLGHHTDQASDSLQQLDKQSLVRLAAAELDRMFDGYRPSYDSKFSSIDPSALYLWTPCVDTYHHGLSQLGLRTTGGFQSEFKRMFSLQETIANFGQTISVGRRPEDDLRQDLLLAAQEFDSGKWSLLYQTYTQEEAISVSIRKAVLLLPQHKYKPGDKVVLLRGYTVAAGSSSSSSGSDSVSPGSLGIVVEQTEPPMTSKISKKSVGVRFEGESEAVQVPVARLLLVEERTPRGGDYVVLHSLQKQPVLSGRLARVQKVPTATSSSSSSGDDRCHVTLVPFLAAAAAGGVSDQLQQQTSLQTIAPKLSCVTAVQQPTAALLIAYADYNSETLAAAEAAQQFIMSTQQQTTPHKIIRTTPREQGMFRRYLTTCKDMLASSIGGGTSGFIKELLGSLKPKLWTLGLMVPVKPPKPVDQQQRHALKKERVCRQCGKPHSKDDHLKSCSLCGAVWYCSRACQTTDWKARHKSECTRKAAADSKAGGPSSSNNHSGASSSSGGGSMSMSGSILVSLVPPQLGVFKYVSFSGGSPINTQVIPTNKYGDKEFLVKACCRFDPSQEAVTATNGGEVMLYDQLRSFLAQLPVGQAGHQELVDVIRTIGRPGRLDPTGKTAYVTARREGLNIRVLLDQLPEQQQPW